MQLIGNVSEGSFDIDVDQIKLFFAPASTRSPSTLSNLALRIVNQRRWHEDSSETLRPLLALADLVAR